MTIKAAYNSTYKKFAAQQSNHPDSYQEQLRQTANFKDDIKNKKNQRSKMKKTILTAALLLIIGQIGFAQIGFDKAKLDNYFNVLEENNTFMGSVAVSKNGEIIYTKSIGFADVENNVKATENSKYRVGSVSKSFTAVLTLKAVEQKKLALDQTIDKWFPTIKNAKKITVKHLLGHRSGIHNLTATPDYLTWNTQPKTEKEMVEIIAKGGSDFKPNSKAEYSNSNFVLLTYILEKTFSKSFGDLLLEFIVTPIGLTNTYVFGQINTNNGECKSYSYTGSWKLESETHFTVPLGAGAITSTPSDLTKFADALFGGKLLTNESLEIMKTIVDNHGIGLFEVSFDKHRGYGHTGGIDGFVSVYSHFADRKISYALISNGRNNIKNKDVSKVVLSAVYGLPYEIPIFTTYTPAPEVLDQYVGIYAAKKEKIKITITKEGNILWAQVTGQRAFPLQPTEKDKFKLSQADAEFAFNLTDKTMILIQGGGAIKFEKESSQQRR